MRLLLYTLLVVLIPGYTKGQALSNSTIEWKVAKQFMKYDGMMIGGSIITDGVQLVIKNNKGESVKTYQLKSPSGNLIDASNMGRVRYTLFSESKPVGIFFIDKSSTGIRMRIAIESTAAIPDEVEYEISEFVLH